MPFTTIAFSEQHTTAATSCLVAGTPDQTHRVSDDDIYIGEYNRIIGAHASGMSIGDAYLVSPSLRGKAQLYITPLVDDLGGYGQFTHFVFDDRSHCPMPLTTNEALNAYMTCTQIDTAEDDVVGVWLANGPITPVTGEIWTISASDSDIAGTKNVWTNGELAFTPDLPVGKYQIVGARCYSTTGGLFRFNFIGAYQRPGGVMVHEQNLQTDPAFRKGHLGVWGEFDSVLPPSIDVLSKATAGFTGVWMRIDLIKIA